ncbi:MAG: glycosyltransferase [Bacteroidetes bacterium]|nr:glycosyltransferase [Bacteroidota bacterium]
MHIVYITPYYKPAWFYGGPPRCISEQAEILVKEFGYTIEVVTLNQNNDKAVVDARGIHTTNQNGVTVHYMPSSCSFLNKKYFHSHNLTSFLSTLKKPDQIHIHTLFNYFSRCGMQFAVRNKIPFVITPHGMLDIYSLTRSKLVKIVHRTIWDNHLLKKAKYIHFTTIEEYENSEIPKGCNYYIAPYLLAEPAKIKRGNYDSLQSFNLVSLGRINRKKGLDILIRSMHIIHEYRLNVTLDIYGEDDDYCKPELVLLAKKLGIASAISFKGKLNPDNRNQTLQQYALLILPSYQENFGLVVVEALSNGLPVIISNKVNLCNMVLQNKCGLVCLTDKESLADRLFHYLNLTHDLKIEMSNNGMKAVAKEFAIEKIAAQYKLMYEGN